MPYTSSSGSEVTAARRPSIYSTSSSSYSGTSTYRTSPSYLGTTTSSYLTSSRTSSISSHTRSSSLDRSVSRDVSSSTYRPSYHHLTSTPVRSATFSTRPPRSTTTSSYLDTTTVSNNIARKLDNDLKSRLARLDFGPHFGRAASSLRNTITTTKSSCDAIHDHITSPVLTNYRPLVDSTHSIVSRRSYDRHSSLDNRLGLKLPSSSDVGTGSSVYNSTATLLDSDSGISASSSSSSGSSSPSLSTGSSRSRSKLSLDENSNRTYSRYPQYDSNHNLCSVKSNEEGEGTKCNAEGSPSLTASLRHSRYGSNDDVSSFSSYGRHRRTSGQASTSGYSSDASSSSSSSSPESSSFRTEKHESGGVIGLRNLGNTCFMNSVLQCLSNTRPLLEYCLRENYLSDINNTSSSMKGALIRAFGNLLQTMWKANSSNDSALNPQAFKSQIQKFAPRFMGYSQQDAQEFLRYLLQGLHEDVNRVTSKPTPLHSDIDDNLSDNVKAEESWRRYLRFDDSKVVDLFVGQLKSTLKCTFCGHTSVTFDPFWDLSLPIPKATGSVRLQHCFDLFTREESLDGEEKPTCARCKTRRKCTKRFTIQKFPKILVIHLKRFSPSEKYKSKLTASVEFSQYNLDLSAYATTGSRGQNCTYNLYGVSNHSGTVYTGHYTAYCKHPYSGEWHDFNDSRVSKVSSNSVVSSEAYVLFYEQITHNSRL